MTKWSQEAVQKVRRTINRVEQMPPSATPGQPFGDMPIMLAIAQEPIAKGATGEAKFANGDKGDESDYGDAIDVYSRFADIEEGAEILVRWVGRGWEVINSDRGAAGSSGICGSCTPPAGHLTAEPVEGLLVSTGYTFRPLCDYPAITFEWDDVEEEFTPVVVDWDCVGGEESLTFTLTISGRAPGDVVVTASYDSNEWSWTSDVAFQPDMSTPMYLGDVTGAENCSCAPWDSSPCLIPVEIAEEE